MNEVNIIGAGLAGCEACYQLAKRGVKVNLFEQKPIKKSAAHKSDNFAELVCSNSFRSDDILNAAGLLKNEMLQLDSLIINTAIETRIAAGGALACDRDEFSKSVTSKIKAFSNVKIFYGEVREIKPDTPTIIATGPLTSDDFSKQIQKLIKSEYLYFFDAASPIIDGESIDFNSAFFYSRYGKGEAEDYVNCPMTKSEYLEFYNELVNAQCAEVKDFENNVFEGCMPIEVMAKRGIDTMRFGPLKPVGIINPKDNLKPYAVVQLRRENMGGIAYNIVGFQTHLKFNEQQRVFSLIPALKNAEFLRFGIMHKNTYISSPKLLNHYYQLKDNANIFFAGQIIGVEGYIESAGSGLVAALNLYNMLNSKPMLNFTSETVLGALSEYISNPVNANNFQPMKANLGLLAPFNEIIKDKIKKKSMYKDRSIQRMEQIKSLLNFGREE